MAEETPESAAAKLFAEEAPEEKKDQKLDELLMKLEKLDGKLEVVDRFRETTDEKASRLSEQIGELRSMILERERSSMNMEKSFEKFEGMMKELNPMELLKEFENKEKKIIQNKVAIEKLDETLKKWGEEVAGFRAVMEKIKSFENLVTVSQEVSAKLDGAEDTKKYMDRMAAKVETIFAELNKKLLGLEESKTLISKSDELTKELVKSQDALRLKIDDIDDRVNKLPTIEQFEEKVGGMAETVDALKKKERLRELEEVSLDLGRRMASVDTNVTELKKLEELSKERMSIMELMVSVEEDHRQGLISDGSYEEVKKKNQQLLDEIKVALKDNFLKLEGALEKEMDLGEGSLRLPTFTARVSTEGDSDKRIRKLEIEMKAAQKLLDKLDTSGMDEKMKEKMGMRYRERIEKLSREISALSSGDDVSAAGESEKLEERITP